MPKLIRCRQFQRQLSRGKESKQLSVIRDQQASEDERGDAEVESERDEIGDRKCDRTSGDFRVEFQ